MGTNISQLERDIGTDFPANEHYFGLVNVSFGKEIFINVFIVHLNFAVWEYMLFKLRAPSSILL